MVDSIRYYCIPISNWKHLVILYTVLGRTIFPRVMNSCSTLSKIWISRWKNTLYASNTFYTNIWIYINQYYCIIRHEWIMSHRYVVYIPSCYGSCSIPKISLVPIFTPLGDNHVLPFSDQLQIKFNLNNLFCLHISILLFSEAM